MICDRIAHDWADFICVSKLRSIYRKYTPVEIIYITKLMVHSLISDIIVGKSIIVHDFPQM